MRWMLYFALFFSCNGLLAQELPTADELKAEGYQVFEHQVEDTTFFMKQYYLCFLMKGDSSSPDAAARTELQKAHLDNINRLAEEKKICLAGPFADNGEMRGILLFTVPTIEEARELAHTDPAVQAGVLKVEIKPIWLAMGSRLF